MLDIKEIRKNPSEIEKKLKTKDPEIDLSSLLEIDEAIRLAQTRVEELKAKRNALSKKIGAAKAQGEDVSAMMGQVHAVNEEIAKLDHELVEKKKAFDQKFTYLPNIPMDDIPISLHLKDNVCIKTFGAKKVFDFPPKNHLELNDGLHLFDFARGAKLSGSGWPVYKDFGARLEWALLNYMLDIHKKNGFCHIMPPLLLKPEMMFGSAHLPKFEDQLFKVADEDFHLYLIPTSEASLNGLHYDEILDISELPLQYVSYTPCFRREAGAAGEKERGLIRTHQFNKVELFSITAPEDSESVFEKMLSSAEEVVQGLELHYKNMLLVTSDMSFASAKTIDLEVWLPGQGRYYEVSSISHCTDFQARRSKIRFKAKNEKPRYVHTLNASGVATSRLMVSLLENHQREDGSIHLPKALQPYLEEEMEQLTPKGKVHVK